MQVVVLLSFCPLLSCLCLIQFSSSVLYLHALKTPSHTVTPFAFCLQTYLKDLKERTVTISVALLSQELPLAVLLEQICCSELILLVFLHLRISLFHLHSWRIFSLNIEFWVRIVLFCQYLKMFFHFLLASDFWWEILCHQNFSHYFLNYFFFLPYALFSFLDTKDMSVSSFILS